MPRENYSLMKYLLICYPEIARLSNNEGNTNSDEVRKEITPQEILLFLIHSLHSYNTVKERQGQVIARELKKKFYVYSHDIASIWGKKQTISPFKNLRIFFFQDNTEWDIYLDGKL